MHGRARAVIPMYVVMTVVRVVGGPHLIEASRDERPCQVFFLPSIFFLLYQYVHSVCMCVEVSCLKLVDRKRVFVKWRGYLLLKKAIDYWRSSIST